MFRPAKIKEVDFRNRIVMPAMCQYTATEEGCATDWHFLHYGTRAVGGVGLIILEATAVEARGRLSTNDLGIYADRHVEGLRKIVQLCQRYNAAVGIQIAHAGRKGCEPRLVAPSALPYPDKPTPRELSQEEIGEIVKLWKAGAGRAREAGFDLLQIHAAHGYLIHEFLSPLSNRRRDKYGGSFQNRLRFLLEVVEAVQEEWPGDKPLSVRLSAVDHLPGGITIEDSVRIAAKLKERGVDLLDVSSGGLLPASFNLAPGYQIKYAAKIKEEVGIPVIAAGLITKAELAQEILSGGRADFVALGRELLRNPYWVLKEAPLQEQIWPRQYQRARL
ncbi:MAG: NADH:flavin oxidoreductase/NADH oxidase [Firmicutes bacterium]|nr:NADH:flavin oxidoreductase/NADH oxidase [Bacillota bacterium]